eukprot:GHVR01022977.1.p2 GENE.GHVR01022977.1~~GHVR01022977.1.p2  ORF type:complete len:161 (-),score=17.92 GHVR01022977.1:271-753(-)
MVEIGDDGTKHAEPPKVEVVGYRSRNPSHQQKSGNVGRRCPCADATFGFIDEQFFATSGCSAIRLERGGEFAWARIPELLSTQRACDAPTQQLASQDWRRFSATWAAARAKLRWPRCNEPTRWLRDICEGHSMYRCRLGAKDVGHAGFLITAQMKIGRSQ